VCVLPVGGRPPVARTQRLPKPAFQTAYAALPPAILTLQAKTLRALRNIIIMN
jgi:hypothetical protein